MNDIVCDALRNIIHDAIDADFTSEESELVAAAGDDGETMRIDFTDIGLEICMGDRLYGIVISRSLDDDFMR